MQRRACCVWYRRLWVQARTSTNACRHVCRYVDQKGSAAMLTSLESAGVAPEVNLRITQARKAPKKGSTLALKPGVRYHQKSNTGVSVAPGKGLMSSKNKNKKLLPQNDPLQLLFVAGEEVEVSNRTWTALTMLGNWDLFVKYSPQWYVPWHLIRPYGRMFHIRAVEFWTLCRKVLSFPHSPTNMCKTQLAQQDNLFKPPKIIECSFIWYKMDSVHL